MNMRSKTYLNVRLLFCIVLTFLLGGCADQSMYIGELPAETSSETPVSIVVATDLHYLSADLTDNGVFFRQLIENCDGKAMQYIEAITDAFAGEVIISHPDVLVLSGDLTFNGASVSHKDLAAKLGRIQDSGTQVLVIPGNHDMNNPNAASFVGTRYELVPSIDEKEFRTRYLEFGYSQALFYDTASLSYFYAVRSDLWMLMLDVNSNQENIVPEETLRWIKDCLQTAEEAGVKVIAVSHQNLLAHNSLFTYGYQIENAEALSEIYSEYGVLCNLSGHMHLQHILEHTTREIVTSALSLSPHQYGYIQYDGKAMNYSTKELDISAWARDRGIDDPVLLDFSSYSRNFAEETARRQVWEEYAGIGLTEEEKTTLADTFAVINTEYFSGNRPNMDELSEGIALWKGQGNSFRSLYVQSILEESVKNHHFISILSK